VRPAARANRFRHHPRMRMIQYSAISVMEGSFAAYWMSAFAGTTTACELNAIRHKDRP
jgi:hypothetical protein